MYRSLLAGSLWHYCFVRLKTSPVPFRILTINECHVLSNAFCAYFALLFNLIAFAIVSEPFHSLPLVNFYMRSGVMKRILRLCHLVRYLHMPIKLGVLTNLY